MKGLKIALSLGLSVQAKEPPTQVVYRFDDHRYLELKGRDCVGQLWFTDTQRGIRTEVVKDFYSNIYSPVRKIYRYSRHEYF